jgi:hypothetical protein
VLRSFLVCGLIILGFARTAEAKLPRSYLAVTAGAASLTGNIGGDVLTSRSSSRLDLGVGFQLTHSTLLEVTYGWSGTWEPDGPVNPLLPGEGFPADTERAFKVGTNPLMARIRWAPGGIRTGYLKPEISAGAGWVQVTRLLRNPAFVPPQETSQLFAALEGGISALVVFSKNFSTSVGLRYTLTERRGVVDETNHLDSIAFLLAFRVFLLSPRDVDNP